jgi:GNAT superfamily N-acetyltransferase
MVGDEITIRQATVPDIPDLMRLRRMMFESMGFDDPAQMDTADAAANVYFAQAIPAKQFYGWLAVTPTGEAVGSGGVVFDQHPPGPTNISGRTGYIMNLATDPRYRRRGIARRMMRTMVEWLTGQSIQRVTLHATDVGRPLYEELGFVDSNEMSLRLDQEHI